MPAKKVIIAAGGTGGHLFPAQALAEQLLSHSAPPEVLFIAGGLSTNRYFDRGRFHYKEVACSPLLSRNPIKCLKGLFNLCRGIKQSIAVLKEFKPDVVVGFGSYYSVPSLLAAKWLKIPFILHVADSIPGKANKALARWALCIGLQFPTAKSYFNGNALEVGLPLRKGYSLDEVDKDAALAYFGLSSQRKTLLICGGSQGSRAINQLIPCCFPAFLKLNLQVIHLTGDPQMAETLASAYQAAGIPAQVKAFEGSMHKAWRAADAFIGRAGASTIAESIEFEVPGILIPYPYATDQHQEKNADFLVETVKGAWKLLEPGLTGKHLAETVERFFQVKEAQNFKDALRQYRERPNRLTLCRLVLNKGKTNLDRTQR